MLFLALVDEQERDEFLRIYNSYKPLVIKTAAKYFDKSYDVEEIVQTVFFRISRNLKNIDTGDSSRLSSYIITVTRNCCYDMLRKMDRSPEVISMSGFEWVLEDDFLRESIDDRLLYTEIVNYILTMPERYRFALYLYYADGFSVSAISVALGIPKSTVRDRINKGIEMIKERFGGRKDG